MNALTLSQSVRTRLLTPGVHGYAAVLFIVAAGCSQALRADALTKSVEGEDAEIAMAANTSDRDAQVMMTYVYVGSGAWGSTSGGKISVYALDASTSKLLLVERIEAGGLLSFIGFHPSRHFLYAGDESVGRLQSYAIDARTGKLRPLNALQASGHPVYVTVTDSGRFVLSAHYGEGRVETFSVAEDGRLGASVGTRATGEQAHSIVLDPSNRFVFVPNKGSNRITQLIFDHSTGQLQPNSPEQLSANGGPRHLAFHPTRPLAYAMNEVVPGMTAYVFDAERGTLAELNQKSAVPAGFSGESSGGDVHVAPSGRFVYGSLRAGDASSIVIYSIDEATGRVSLVGHESTRGRTPRNFTIHPDGSLLLAANQDSNSISTFRVDQQTGLLEFIETTDVGVAPFFVHIVRF